MPQYSLAACIWQAVLINPGWNDSAEPGADCVARNLASIPVPKLTPRGFVCIWADKTRTWPIFQQLRKWGYVYVENLTWVRPGFPHALPDASCGNRSQQVAGAKGSWSAPAECTKLHSRHPVPRHLQVWHACNGDYSDCADGGCTSVGYQA